MNEELPRELQTGHEFTLRVYDIFHQLLNQSRIKCGLLEARNRRLEESAATLDTPVITPALHRAIEMTISAWKESCDVYAKKYGDAKWGNELLAAFIDATKSHGDRHE